MVGGNDEFLKKYKDLADKLNVTDNIIFTRYQSDVSVFYKII